MQHPMWTQWSELLNDPAFSDRACDVETNETGQLIVTPVSDNHSFYSFEIGYLLKQHLPEGIVQVETPLVTSKGNKSPDVTWCSQGIHEQRKNTIESPLAPEICVEVLSPGNQKAEIDEKIELYFEQGAEEVWICDLEGRITFYILKIGLTALSHKDPKFPKKIEL